MQKSATTKTSRPLVNLLKGTWKEAHGLYLDNVYKIDATYPLALALQLDEVSVISVYVHVFNLNEH